MTKQIELTKGKFALVDDEDFEWLSKYKWCVASTAWGGLYAVRGKNGKLVRMHREIIGAINSQVDHIDGNGLNNTRGNLRRCSQSQNNMNRSIPSSSKTGYKGVSFEVRSKKFRTHIMVNKKTIFIGRYSTAIEAAIAYDNAAKKYHGEFAKTNF